jgi:hypothetical protein
MKPATITFMRLASRFTEKRALAVTVCWIVVLALTGSTDVLLFLAPALLIAVPLFAGRYFGEELIAKLIAKQGDHRPRRSPASLLPTPRALPIRLPRGTRLIAFSLAKRPPPPLRLLTQT